MKCICCDCGKVFHFLFHEPKKCIRCGSERLLIEKTKGKEGKVND